MGIVGISRDITDMKQVEEKIRESEKDFRSQFENSTFGVYRTTPEGRFLLVNTTIVRMLSYKSFEELASRNLEECVFGLSYLCGVFKEKLEQDDEVRGLEAAWKRQDGNILYVRESARAGKDESGRGLYYEGTVEDITDKKLAEMALDEQKELFQAVIDRAEDVVFALNRNYELFFLTRRLLEF